jgi:hypothetical protein
VFGKKGRNVLHPLRFIFNCKYSTVVDILFYFASLEQLEYNYTVYIKKKAKVQTLLYNLNQYTLWLLRLYLKHQSSYANFFLPFFYLMYIIINHLEKCIIHKIMRKIPYYCRWYYLIITKGFIFLKVIQLSANDWQENCV